MMDDISLKLSIYRFTAEHARVPTVAELAPIVGLTASGVREGFQRLFASRVLVLMPDGETIRMAPPFSGVPTQHRVRTGGKDYYANCAWDALGILAALHAEGEVFSRCEQSMEPVHLVVGKDGPAPASWVVHFAVPASQWWQDIVFT